MEGTKVVDDAMDVDVNTPHAGGSMDSVDPVLPAGVTESAGERNRGGVLCWIKSLGPTGLEGEGFFPDIVPKVDAVDFEDSGDEGDGDYDLIEDPDSGEKYKVARDEALEFYTAGACPRLARAVERAERAERARRAAQRRAMNGGGDSSELRARSVSSDEVSEYESDQSDDDDDRNGHDNEVSCGIAIDGGSRRRSSSRWVEEELYWSETPSGVFASSSSSSSLPSLYDSEAEDAEERRDELSYSHWGPLASADFAEEKAKSASSTGATLPPADSTAVVYGGDSCRSDGSVSDEDDADGADGEKEAASPVAGEAEGNVVVGDGTPSDPEEKLEMNGDVEGDSEGGPGALVGANEEKGVNGNGAGDDGDVDDAMGVATSEGAATMAPEVQKPAAAAVAAADANGGGKESRRAANGGGGRVDLEEEQDDEGDGEESVAAAEERTEDGDDVAAVVVAAADAVAAAEGPDATEGKGQEDMKFIEEENAAEVQATGRTTVMDAEDDVDDDEVEPETIGAVARLGLRAELMPVAQRDWESAVCLGDSSDEEGRESGSGGIGVGVRAAEGERDQNGTGRPASPAAMSVSDDGEEEEGKRRDGKGEGALRKRGTKRMKPARLRKGSQGMGGGGIGGSGGAGGAASFPAAEGVAWVDPPSVLNPQVDSGGWESAVLFDDSQKVRRPTLPPCLDDPDMLLGALETPRPALNILQTETQQENTNIAERTNRRQMALEKQRRLQSAAVETGYTINTLGEGKASRAENNIRAVIIRPPHHAAPAEDKVLLSVPRSWDDVRNLHRPRVALSTLVPSQKWVVRLPKRQQSTDHGRHSGALGARIGEVVAMPMHRERDLSLLDGRSTFIVLEYSEERPPLLGMTGMASSIITFARSSSRRQMGTEAVQNTAAGGFGERRELSQQEDSPFLGEIRPGTEQPSICNGLFRAPIFKHKAPDTDFLIIREPLSKKEKERLEQRNKDKEKGKGGFFGGGSGDFRPAPPRLSHYYVVRNMPVTFIVGQTEPQMEAHDPAKPAHKAAHLNICAFLACRVFDGARLGEPDQPGIPFSRLLDEARHLTIEKAKDPVRNRLKDLVREIAERRDAKDDPEGPVPTVSLWSAKPFVDVKSLTAQLASTFRPEDVCALESMLAAWIRLTDLGVDTLTSHEAVAKALVKIKKRHDSLAAQVKEVRSAATALGKQRALLIRAAKAKGKSQPDHDGGLSRRLMCMEKLAEVLGSQLTELKRVRSVAQYMHKELQMVPWTLTANFLKHHGTGPGQASALLMLSGVGDPSGCGEGFSFLTRPTEQIKSTAASLTPREKTVAERSVQKVTGTNGDLRRLTMIQLASTCEAMGIPKDTVKTLKRWDRVHMIKELAGVAVAENVKDQNIYARFVRKKRPNATVDKDLYKATCIEIWDRQAAALSATAGDVQEYGSESKSSIKGNGKAKEGGSSSGAGGDGPSAEGGGRDGEGEAKGKGKGKGKDSMDVEDEDEDDEPAFDEDEFDLSDLEETLEGDGDGDFFSRKKTLGDLSAAKNKDGEELDDERQLLMLQQELQGDRGDAARWGVAEDGAAGSGLFKTPASVEEVRKAQTEELLAKLGGRAELPAQAVRRITRTVGADGTETVKVMYSLRRQDLVRLDSKSNQRKTKASKAAASGAPADAGMGVSPLGFFIPRPQEAAIKKSDALQEKGGVPGDDVVLKIRLNPKATVAAKDNKRKRSGGSQASRGRKKEENLYAVKRHNSRLTVESRDKLPRNRMRNALSEIIGKLKDRTDSEMFRAPVKRTMAPEYYKVIKKPIDLRTIQEKNSKFEYTSREALMVDMRLLAANAAVFNGTPSELAKIARDLMQDCENQLQSPEIEEIEIALTKEHETPTKSGSRKGKSRGGGGGGGGGGNSKGSRSGASTKKKPAQSASRARTGVAAARGGVLDPRGLGGVAAARLGLAIPSQPSATGPTITNASRPSLLSSAAPPPSLSATSPSSLSAAAQPQVVPAAPATGNRQQLSTIATFAQTGDASGTATSVVGTASVHSATLPQGGPSVTGSKAAAAGRTIDAGGADAGTSSDSSDGEEVVEEGGRVAF